MNALLLTHHMNKDEIALKFTFLKPIIFQLKLNTAPPPALGAHKPELHP